MRLVFDDCQVSAPGQGDEGTGKWVTDKTRLSAFEACLASHKVEASGQVHEYDVENVIHSTSQISPMHLQKPALVSE